MPRSVYLSSDSRYAATQLHYIRRWRLCSVLAPSLHRRLQAIWEACVMDSVCFDALARSLTTTHSRGGAVGVLLGGILLLLTVRPEEASAHDPSKKCKR